MPIVVCSDDGNYSTHGLAKITSNLCSMGEVASHGMLDSSVYAAS